jgi:CAAX protease family protein
VIASLQNIFFGPARYRAETPWGPFSALLATVIIVVLPVVMLWMLSATLLTVESSGLGADQLSRQMISLSMPVGVATAIGTQVLSLALVWLFAGRAGQRRQTLSFVEPSPALSVCLVIGLGLVAIMGLVELLLYALIGFDIFTDSKFLVEGLRSPLWPFTVVMAVVIAPLWEELVFRGFLLSSFAKSRLGYGGSAVLTSALWAMLHMGYSVPALLSVFIAGLILSWLVWKTGNLWIAIICHGVVNACAVAFAWTFSPF